MNKFFDNGRFGCSCVVSDSQTDQYTLNSL
jgi:hypothetical protein